MAAAGPLEEESDGRAALVRRGRRLSYLAIGYNCLEGIAATLAGVLAGSVALVGFGVDSGIEVASSLAALWRLSVDVDPARRESIERLTLRLVGTCFAVLACYIVYDSISVLISRAAPKATLAGMLIAGLSVVIMPILSRAKRRVAVGLSSRTLSADAKQTGLCAYLSAIVLGGLLINALFGWWWADPVAALAMTPIIAREGIEGLRAKDSCANPD